MTDQDRPEYQGWNPQGGSANPYPSYPDPAYGSSSPPYQPHPTAPLPHQQWDQIPSPGGSSSGGEPPRKKSPRWLWVVAGLAVLVAGGLVITLVLADKSANKSTSLPSPSTSAAGGHPTTTSKRSPGTGTSAPPTSSETSSPGATEAVVYNVTGDGQAINISYLGPGGALKTEFNVQLPWNKEVSLTSSEADQAIVTVANFGSEVTCTVTVNGTEVVKNSGSIVTVCAATGG